jgi:hypothetical protein
MDNLEIELIDLMDTISFTLSKEFLNKWKFKYGERIIRLFQIKILDSMKNQKPIKLKVMYKFLVKDSGFNPEVVIDFFKDIDFEIYSPILSGHLGSIEE